MLIYIVPKDAEVFEIVKSKILPNLYTAKYHNRLTSHFEEKGGRPTHIALELPELQDYFNKTANGYWGQF